MAVPTRRLSNFIQSLAYRAVIGTAMSLPYSKRVPFVGWAVSHIAGLAGWRKRIRNNLALIMPELTEPEIRKLVRKVPDNVGRTLIEIWSGQEFRARARDIPFTGSGVAALEKAKAENRPTVLITGHFGNYDAVRAALIERGYRVGGLYIPMANGYFNDRYVEAISRIGKPVFERSRSGKGQKEMVRFLKSGGAVGLIADHFMGHGVPIEFLGHPARTALNPAKMAVKYDALFVPIYGLRLEDGISFNVIVEDPIPHGDPMEMTRAATASLERLVRRHPEQWFWIHRRWKNSHGK